MGNERDSRQDHQHYFNALDEPHQARLLILVRKLAGDRRKQEERQNENRPGDIG